MSEREERVERKPDYVQQYERDADGDDPWWRDNYQVEDMASVAAWYRSRLDDLLAALEGAEPVAWKWKCILGHAGIDTWSPTSCPLCRFQGRIVECEPLYRHPPEHGTGRDLLRAVRNLCRDRGYAGPPIIELIKQLVRGEREAISEVGEAVICGHLDNLSNAHQTNLSLLLHRTDRREGGDG